MVPWTCVAPASTAAMELATAQPPSLWAWMPSRAPVVSRTSRTISCYLLRQRAAVGVAERHDIGARLRGDTYDLQGISAVGPVAVEEVLGVEEDPLPVLAQVLDGVGDHLQVLV